MLWIRSIAFAVLSGNLTGIGGNALSIHAIIFDLDNTLVNRKQAFEVYSEKLVDKFLNEMNQAERRKTIEFIRVEDRDGYRSKRELYQELKEKLSWKRETSVDELIEFWFSEFSNCTVLMENAVDVLESIKDRGYKLGLITNGSIHSQNAKIDKVGIREYFDCIVVSDEVGIKKPDARIFQMVVNDLGVSATNTWYVGDHPVNDYKGARDAGLNAIWFEGFQEWGLSEEKPEFSIKRLNELFTIFERETEI